MLAAEIDRIKEFVTENSQPTIEQLLRIDRPDFRLISILVQKLLGHPVSLVLGREGESLQLQSEQCDPLLTITNQKSEAPTLQGLYAQDLTPFLAAIRIHEVESYDLILLPPDMRKKDLEFLCRSMGLPHDRLQRLIKIWMDN